VIGALNLLSAMKRHGVNRFVFSSTCATYGEPKYVPIDENHLQQPINPYGRTKLMIEHAIRDYSVAYGIQCIGLRYFNAAGSDPFGRVGERHDPETHPIPLILLEAKRLKLGGNFEMRFSTVPQKSRMAVQQLSKNPIPILSKLMKTTTPAPRSLQN